MSFPKRFLLDQGGGHVLLLDLLIDGGGCGLEPTTVVDLSGSAPVVLRQGKGRYAYTGLAFFAALGLPGLSSFISEALVLVGSFQQYKIITITATTGIILTAGYFLWTMQRVFLGPLNKKYAELPEISLREAFTLTPLALIVILLGFYPMPVLDLIGTTLRHTVALVAG